MGVGWSRTELEGIRKKREGGYYAAGWWWFEEKERGDAGISRQSHRTHTLTGGICLPLLTACNNDW